MKMDVAKMYRFLATSVLPFILLVHSTVACVRDPIEEHKNYYCKHDIVIGGTYLDTWNDQTPINNFKIIRVVKSPCDMKGVIQINTADRNKCRYYPRDVNNSFIVAANRKNGQIVCVSNQTSISPEEREALERISKDGCKPIFKGGCNCNCN